MSRVLFVCSQNRLRSPAAEQVFDGDMQPELVELRRRKVESHL